MTKEEFEKANKINHLVRTTLILKQFQNQESGQFMYLDENTRLYDEGSLEDEMWKHTRTFNCEVKEVKEVK